MAKPTHQWETRQHRALRLPDRPARLAADARAEAFVLEFADGRVGAAECGLAVQYVDEHGAADPDLAHAVSAWLIARGARAINLCRADDGEPIATGRIGPEQLGVAPDQSFAGPIVSICPSNAEAVWALGCFDRVIACEDSSDFPPEVESRERLGPDLGPNLDRIAELTEPPGALVISSLSVP
ncbi:MAG TPA: hypothetical protein VM869_37285, partial [Enhygromyxa sp.]|nr:hypothetical protein [Enhygromyxa sp.]